MTDTDLRMLATILPTVFANKNWTRQWRLFELARDWPAIVGPQVAALTGPAFFRGDVLWIHVQDSAWMQHLQYAKLDLLARVNAVLGDRPATDLRWLQQPIEPPSSRQPTSAANPIDPAQERLFAEMARTISDPACREALLRLWRAFAAHESG